MMKNYMVRFLHSKSYRDQMVNKKDIFEEELGHDEALALVMITTKGLKKNTHSNILTDHFTLDILFAKN